MNVPFDLSESSNSPACMIWLTGLSGAGKTTLAGMIEERLRARSQPVYLLDGDELRTGLNKDLGFSPADREENVRRTAEVARILCRAGVTPIVACISPFRMGREQARAIAGPEQFFEVFVDTDLSVCEGRDVKGLYRRARAGDIPEFTGISSPYEVPTNPEVHLITASKTPEDCAEEILAALFAWRSEFAMVG